MKYSKVVLALLGLGLTIEGAFAFGLTPTWAINGSAFKLVPYPHANNRPTQAATANVYGYTFANNGGAQDEVVVTDYNPTTGIPSQWSFNGTATDPYSQLMEGDMDGDNTGAYVLFREKGPKGDFVRLEQFTNAGMGWDINGTDGVSTALNPDGAPGAIPLFARVDDLFVYTVVQGASGKTMVAIYDKVYHYQVANYTLPSGYTATSAYLQRRFEIVPTLGASFIYLATYCPSGVSLFQIVYNFPYPGGGTTMQVTNTPAQLFNPPGVTGYTNLTTQTTSSGTLSPITSGVDCTGTYAYMVATSTYQVSGVTRTCGFDLVYNVAGPTPIYSTYISSVRSNPLWESNGAAVCTQKCNGYAANNNIWAQTTTFFTSAASNSINYIQWFPDVNGTEYGQQTAYPYGVQQCAAYYNATGLLQGSVAWYGGDDPNGNNGGGITEYLSLGSNPLGGIPLTFTQQGFGGLQDMEEGGMGELYVSLPGDPLTGTSLFRFDAPWSLL
ncbi:MAG TPA: hypothetical protein VGL56_09850 [Fimbriimonadaceae bacterium]|jgi:hypothetical protein